MGGLLPRGVGYKTLNALDLEKHLKKNLEVIQKAIKSKSDDEINQLLKQEVPKILKSKPLKSKTPTNPLIQEAKKYKSAEEF